MKRNIIMISLVLLFFFGSLEAMSVLRKSRGSFTIINNASIAVAKGSIEVCRQKFDIGKLDPGEKQVITFNVKGESAYIIFIQFVDGKIMERTDGYVSSSFDYEDKLVIKDHSVILERGNRQHILVGGQLAKIEGQIDSIVKEVYRTGKDCKINIVFEDDGILIISPPYALVSDLGKDLFSPELMKEIDHFLLVHETGQMFYIKQGHLVDHRLLSGLAEPILGLTTKKEVVLLISRKQTSGRPVRIEIEK